MYTDIANYKSQHMADKSPLKEAWQSHVTRFLKFCPNHICGNSEAWHFKFRVQLIHRSASARMIYINTPQRDV